MQTVTGGPDDCTTASIDKIRRVMVGRDAGTEQAIAWATSNDAARREFAAQVLGDIGTARAREYLKRLAADPVVSVAGAASVEVRDAPDNDASTDALESIDDSSRLDPSG